MIRARLTDGSFVLGIDAENVARLKAGQSIGVNLAQIGGKDTVYIIYGETLADVMRELGVAPALQPTSGIAVPGVKQ